MGDNHYMKPLFRDVFNVNCILLKISRNCRPGFLRLTLLLPVGGGNMLVLVKTRDVTARIPQNVIPVVVGLS